MYESHWELTARPFGNRSQEEFYYPAEVHQAALLKLRYAVENRRSVAVLSGTSGMGKSLLLQSLRNQLPEFVSICATLNFPAMEPSQFVRTVAGRVAGEQVSKSAVVDTAESIERLESFLSENARQDRHAVIAIDEAHLLEQNGLIEPLRLLLNLGASVSTGESAITMVLCGQPTLIPHIQRNASLDERVAVRCVLNRFAQDETTAYVGHRIRAAGGFAEKIFGPGAIDTVHQLTQGIPRRINRLCDLALMVGYAQEVDRISGDLIDTVNDELAAPSLVKEF